MANVDVTGNTGSTVTAGSHPGGRSVRNPYVVDVWVTAAQAVAAKGSALASSDVIQVLDVPAETLVLGCLAEITTADSGTTLTFDIGFAGDTFVDGGDATTAGYLAGGTNGVQNFANGVLKSATDTLDITLATLSAASDDWVCRLAVVMLDVSGKTSAPPDSA